MNLSKYIKRKPQRGDYLAQYLKNEDNERTWLEDCIDEFFQDGDLPYLLRCVEYVIKVRGRGTIASIAKKLETNQRSVREILNHRKKPRVEKVFSLIRGMGYKIKFRVAPRLPR